MKVNKATIARALGTALIIVHTIEEILERVLPLFAGAGAGG